MPLTASDGSLVLVNASLGTGQECCKPCCTCSTPATPAAVASDQERGLVWITFEAECFGSGATATVDAPQAASPCDYEGLSGAIEAVTLTNGGSGYAKLGRVAPTITAATSGGGSGATLSVTTSKTLQDCDVPYWSVSGVTVTDSGSGYSDNTNITFSVAGGDTVEVAAAAKGFVKVAEPSPTVTVSSVSGSGADLSVVWQVLAENQWQTVARGSPCQGPPKKTYGISDITIADGGSGYERFDIIQLSFASASDGAVLNSIYADVDAVDGNGAITALYLELDGSKYVGRLTDELAEVVTHAATGSAQCGQPSGKYYREDSTVAPYVSPVTVVVNQEAPSTGGGADITAVVEDDTDSEDFGKIVSLTLNDGGSGYLNAPDCGIEKVYVSLGGQTLEVPITPATEIESDGVVCGSDLPEDLTLNATRSNAYMFGAVQGCACGGKIRVRAEVLFRCYEIYQSQITIELAERINFQSSKFFCFAFDNDAETGCPVESATLVSQTDWGPLSLYQANNNPFSNANGCGAPANPDYENLEDCPCDLACQSIETPTVSLMP